jgi:adapter protein MecA 1/2
MKIEKVNDHQIRCTLTAADLANRQLKISELAYGSEKAKNLFRDMMQQASFEFGFEAEDIPLMIEAIPVNADCIVLIITKVENPDEIDTRFSKFAPSVSNDEDADYDDTSSALDFADDVLDLFHRIRESGQKYPEPPMTPDQKKDNVVALPRLLCTTQLGDLCTFARCVSPFYTQETTLYKNPSDKSYGLLLTIGELSFEDFGRICNIASEYGTLEPVQPPKQAFLQEHYETIVADNAVSSLAQI